jgi:GxxExxY protein
LWDVSERVLGACIEVHRCLGPGLLESVYEACVCREMVVRGIAFERQRALPIEYKGVQLECGYRMDLVIERQLLVELKCVAELTPIHEAQVLTYLKLASLRVGLLVNFNSLSLRHGVRRLVRSSPVDSSPLPRHNEPTEGVGER